MKPIKLMIAVLALACSAAAAGSASAGELRAANVRNCTWCHGTSAQGYATAPRLAGQRSGYIEKQLVSFANHARDNPRSREYMWNATEALSRRTAHDLATYFSTLTPRAANDGRRELVAKGRTIYELGIPDANIVSCLVCHAPNAEGVRDIPRLAGLGYAYLKTRLRQWGEGYHAAAEYPMPKVARTLSADEIEALASYLSFVK
jgi:cytochrome c553